MNGVAFISSPLIPVSQHGTQFTGLAHLADIYLTVAVGIAGLSIDISATGPIPPDRCRNKTFDRFTQLAIHTG